MSEQPTSSPEEEQRDIETDSHIAAALLEATQTIEKPAELRVGVGSIVTIQFDEFDSETIRIVDRRGPDQPDGRIVAVSVSSPLGAKIIGREVGSVLSYETPGGRTDQVTITAIE